VCVCALACMCICVYTHTQHWWAGRETVAEFAVFIILPLSFLSISKTKYCRSINSNMSCMRLACVWVQTNLLCLQICYVCQSVASCFKYPSSAKAALVPLAVCASACVEVATWQTHSGLCLAVVSNLCMGHLLYLRKPSVCVCVLQWIRFVWLPLKPKHYDRMFEVTYTFCGAYSKESRYM